MVPRVGLTGGIGCGKTTVSDRFASHGVTVVDADLIAHEVTRAGEPVVVAIRETFGTDMVDADGVLDRAALRRVVFDDPDKRRQLESLLHPVIRERMNARAAAADSPYCILSIPLLVESHNAARVDRILVVDAPEVMRRQWIRERSGLDDTQIDAIIDAQATREERLRVADDVIVNDGSIEQLHQRVDATHLRYLAWAASPDA